jgi:hypothetical protein
LISPIEITTASQLDMKSYSITQMAGMLPNDAEFRAFVSTFVTDTTVTVDVAAQFIRVVCGIKSRKDLATNRVAQQRFQRLLMRPFNDARNASRSRALQ